MALFLAALLHTFFVGIVALYSRQTNRRWDIFEDDEMRRYGIAVRKSHHVDRCWFI